MIKKTDGKYIVKLDSRIYSKSAVEKAIIDFSEFLDAQIAGDIITLSLKIRSETIPYEFCNYIFGLMRGGE